MGHSELIVHSGRQEGGLPEYCGWQLQTACPLLFRHKLLEPQGVGVQGSV